MGRAIRGRPPFLKTGNRVGRANAPGQWRAAPEDRPGQHAGPKQPSFRGIAVPETR